MSDTSASTRSEDSPRGKPPTWRIEGAPAGKGTNPTTGPRKPSDMYNKWRPFMLLGITIMIINLLTVGQFVRPASKIRLPYNVFRDQVAKGNVKEVTSRADNIEGKFRTAFAYPTGGRKAVQFKTNRPPWGDDGLYTQLQTKNVEINAHAADGGPGLVVSLLLNFGPTFLILWLLFRGTKKMGGMGGLMGIGKSKAKRYDATGAPRTTFADVAGIDEAEDELTEIVDFLKNPDRYRQLGATIPKGVLLSGQPGTGKTLLAKAVAGEANVPFFSMSASEFVEMIVGVGASRVRDLFAQAKAVAPAIIFIDEIDAIGRSRSGNAGFGANSEQEQTLNQILTEMDGFTGSEGVIVLASTNRPEVLDSALLRPGRFDRRVVVNPPDQLGRQKILEVHTRSVPLAEDVDLSALASTTPGMVGADLRNLVNEAALLAAKRSHDKVSNNDFTDAMEKIVLGTERKILLSHADRERTAYHESGHALLGMLQPGADPVRKISIVPRGNALGVTFQSPDADRYSYDANYLRGRIVGALGGRAAEEVVYGEVTTGAANDLEVVTRLARQMVGRWGMSAAIGPLSVLPDPLDPGGMLGESGPSPATRELVDSETRRIVEECYVRALALLRENRPKLDALGQALLTRETLDELDAYEIAEIDRPAKVTV